MLHGEEVIRGPCLRWIAGIAICLFSLCFWSLGLKPGDSQINSPLAHFPHAFWLPGWLRVVWRVVTADMACVVPSHAIGLIGHYAACRASHRLLLALPAFALAFSMHPPTLKKQSQQRARLNSCRLYLFAGTIPSKQTVLALQRTLPPFRKFFEGLFVHFENLLELFRRQVQFHAVWPEHSIILVKPNILNLVRCHRALVSTKG